jgi:hypothetical protein
VKGLNKLSKEGKMSGLFNLLHKPSLKRDSEESILVNPEKQEVQPIILKDKSADEFEEVED